MIHDETIWRHGHESCDADLKDMRERKDIAYRERKLLVALVCKLALDKGWCVGVGVHEDIPNVQWDPEWRTVIYVDMPTGQVSWHIHDSDKSIFAGLPKYPAGWDGHSTQEKYRRVVEWEPKR